MSSESRVLTQPFVFDSGAGTSTTVTAAGTGTSRAQPNSRLDFTYQVNSFTTGTSGCLCTVVIQASNDNAAWFAISSSTASATSAATTTATQSAGVAVTGNRFASMRAVATLVGTGSASVWWGQ